MTDDDVYGLLQDLASPVVAITSRLADEINGMIANSAIRASLVPDRPRVAFYCFKNHHSHKLISESGSFCLHSLHRDQYEVVRALGFRSGKNHDKLSDIPHEITDRGLPALKNVRFYLECDVINSMDAGPSTFFMGDVVNAEKHPDYADTASLDSEYFRSNMPEDLREDYETNKRQAQEWARDHLEVDPNLTWTD